MTPAETVIFWVECFIKYDCILGGLLRTIKIHYGSLILWARRLFKQKQKFSQNVSFSKVKKKKKHIKTAYPGKKNGKKNQGWKIKKLVDFIYQCKKKVQLDFSLWNICQRINSFHFVSMFRLNVMVLHCNTVMLVMPLI